METNQQIDHVLAKINAEASVFEKAKLRDQLIFYINYLFLNDFNKLVQLLYRVDVNEEKLRGYLAENSGTDAAVLITDMLVTRQEQKNKTRDSSQTNGDIPEDEKW